MKYDLNGHGSSQKALLAKNLSSTLIHQTTLIKKIYI